MLLAQPALANTDEPYGLRPPFRLRFAVPAKRQTNPNGRKTVYMIALRTHFVFFFVFFFFFDVLFCDTAG